MKYLYTFLFVLSLMMSAQVVAQKIEVSESTEKIADGRHNALVVKVYGWEAKDVEDEARKEWRGMGNVKSRSNPVFIDDATDRKMGDNPFDFYARAEDVEENVVKLIVAVNLGGAYMNSGEHKDRYKAMEEMVREFAIRISKEKMEEKVQAREDKLEEIEDQLKDIEKDREDQTKLIEDKKKEIKKAEKAIKNAEKEIEDLKDKKKDKLKEIEKQKEAVKAAEEKVDNVK